MFKLILSNLKEDVNKNKHYIEKKNEVLFIENIICFIVNHLYTWATYKLKENESKKKI